MEKTNKCLKEWNAIIEALGQGKQTILIRKYSTNAPMFLLYPTFSYATKDNYLKNFKKMYNVFVEENAFPKKEGDKTQIKYVAKVEKVVEKSIRQISALNKYHIWHNDHVKKYLENKKGYIWILRVYKLNKPYMAEVNKAMIYVNLNKAVSLVNASPILNDKSFSEIVDEIV